VAHRIEVARFHLINQSSLIFHQRGPPFRIAPTLDSRARFVLPGTLSTVTGKRFHGSAGASRAALVAASSSSAAVRYICLQKRIRLQRFTMPRLINIEHIEK